MIVTQLNELENEKCTACGACMNACGMGAITFDYIHDEYFRYPSVDEKKCIKCGKCKTVCPIDKDEINKKFESPKVYIAAASDELRKYSSSGAIFPLLADYVLSINGIIIGAQFDEEWDVVLTEASTKEECEKFKQSKYVSVKPTMIYRLVKNYLEKDKAVLFTGAPCQVSGLYHFLGKKYDRLYTMDFICHGVPSDKVFHEYINVISEGRQVCQINFRNKKYGWDYQNLFLEVLFKDGNRHLIGGGEDPYYKGFLNAWYNRKSCGECAYAKIPRIADITVGDCWGIEKWKPELYDGKGLSWVSLNSFAGENLFLKIKKELKICNQCSVDDIVTRNMCFTVPKKIPDIADRAWEVYKKSNIVKANQSIDNKYDIALICNVFGENYGSLLSAWSLYRIIKNLGFSVIVASATEGIPQRNGIVGRFVDNHYFKGDIMDGSATWQSLRALNKITDVFLLGSEQYWKGLLTRKINPLVLLSFVDDCKYKATYAVSQNEIYWGGGIPDRVEKEYWLKRINKVSVREEESIDTLKNIFDIEASVQIDPVLLAGREYIDRYIGSNDELEREYLVAYFLEPNLRKDNIIDEISDQYKEKKIVCMTFGENNELRMRGSRFEFIGNSSVEEWVNTIKKSKLLITDSYHGVCVAILYHVDFVVVPHENRGIRKIVSLLNITNITNHIFYDNEMNFDEFFGNLTPIDWEGVDSIIAIYRKRGKRWLLDTITEGIDYERKLTDFDVIRREIETTNTDKKAGGKNERRGLIRRVKKKMLRVMSKIK